MANKPNFQKLAAENQDLRARLEKAEESLREILSGEADALYVAGAGGAQLFALKGADQSYRTLIENMSEGALTLTSAGLILYANRRFAEMLGAPLEKVIGSEILTWFPRESRPVLQTLLRKDVVDNRREELAIAAADGSQVPINLSVSHLILDETHDSFCMVVTDLTEQKRNAAIIAAEKLSNVVLGLAADADQVRLNEAAKQAAILNALPASIALLDSQGIILSVNEAWQRFGRANAGHHPGHDVGVNYLKVCDEALGDDAVEASQAAAGIRAVLDGKLSTFTLEYPCHSPAEQRWFLMTVTPLAGYRSKGVVAMHLNITAGKLAANALRESEKEFRTLSEAMPQIVWITRADGWNIYFNQHWMDYTGLTLEESLGHGWNKPFHPDDQQHAWDTWQKATATTGTYSIESRLRRADGIYRWWLVRGVPLLGPDGSILKWFGTCTDIHDLKAAEVALRRTKEQLSEALTIAKIGYWEYKLATDEFIFNDQYYLLHKITADDAGGYRMSSADFVSRYVYPEDAPIVGHNVQLALEAQDPDYFAKTETRILSGDGEVIWVDVRFRTQKDMQGKTIGLIGVNQDITDRKLAELKLLESERRFRELLDSVALISMMLDREGRITYCNDYLLRSTGWQRDELIGRNWFEVFVPPEISDLKGDFFAALLTNLPETWHHENEILTRSGDRRLVRWNNSVLRSGSGEVIGTASIGEDITEQKRAEHAVVEIQRRSDIILASVEEGIYGIDLEGIIIFKNPAARRLLGYGSNELVGKQSHATLHYARKNGTPYPIAECPMQLTMLDGIVRRVDDDMFWRKDGSGIPVEYTIAPLRDDQNALSGVVVAFRDVTQRKEAEKALRESENGYRESRADAAQIRDGAARLQAILDTVLDGIITFDERRRIETFNPAAERIFGYAADAVVGRNIKMLMPASYHSQHDNYLEHHRITGEARIIGSGHEVRGQRQDGSTFPIDLAVSEMILHDEPHYTGVVRDITERKVAEQAVVDARIEAERANAAKNIFLATMSHEIRTPMNGVIGMIDVLQQSSLSGPQIEMSNIIRDSAYALLAVINDILDFSKIEAGKLEIERVPMCVAEVVEKTCEIMDRMALKSGVELSLFTDPAIPVEILGDPGRLRQILINLANNAIKFSSKTDRSGRVSVRALLAERNADHVTLEFRIADNGIGINEATRARLFSPFIQADASTTHTYGGTGLGLAISHQLANMMNGEITVQSEPGKGAAFTVRIPFALLTEQHTPQQNLFRKGQSDRNPNLVAGLSCLVVGCPDGLADDLATYLEYGKAMVDRTSDLPTAEKWIASHRSGRAIVVVDTRVAMPPLDELIATARAHTKSDIHFVVIGPGSRREPRVEDNNRVSVNGNALTRRALLNAVATAAGRITAHEPDALSDDSTAPVMLLSSETARRRGSRILVAEDNAINQNVILHQLALLGYVADIADDGREALARWHMGNHALLLTDLHMPKMDGYELTAAIRSAERKGERLPIIALTANALKSEEIRCKKVGMNAYLSKPVPLDQLQTMLETWLPIPGLNETAGDVPAPTASQRLAVLDRTVLPKQIGNDPVLVAQFMQDYRRSAQNAAAEIRTSLAAGNWKAASDGAHKLKSSSHAIGALALGDICAHLEQAGKDVDAGAALALAVEFEHSLTTVLAAIDQEEK